MASCTTGESHGAAFDFRLKRSTGGATQKGQVQPRQLKEKQPIPFPRCGVENTCTIAHLPFSASMAGGRISFGLPLFHSKPCTPHPPCQAQASSFPPPGHSKELRGAWLPGWTTPSNQSTPLHRMLSVLLPPDTSLGAEGKRKAVPVNRFTKGRAPAPCIPSGAPSRPPGRSLAMKAQRSHCALVKADLAAGSEVGFMQFSLTR